MKTKWVSFCLLTAVLFLQGCGGATSVSGPAYYYPGDRAMVVMPEQRVHEPETQNIAIATPQKKFDERRAPETTAVQAKMDQERVTAERSAKQEPQEAKAEAVDSSLLFKQEDSEEDNLSSLLTADYLGQFDIPVVFNDAVQYFIKYFTVQKRKIFANWLRRSKRYVPMIREILREHGLPEDLIYLAMIESGFNPKAYSAMKACGPWQFIYQTGGRYGLRVNHWVDERRDPEKSTVAAALYLKALFNQFGTWYLAAAAYNAGEKRIERSVEKHETYDFWELSKYNTLPRETREYIPRLLAAAIVAKDPERFGFFITDYDQPIQFVTEKVPGGVPLGAVAKAASTDMPTVRALNPELLTGITPPDVDEYTIKLPEGFARGRFRENLEIALERGPKVRDARTYVAKKRDSLSRVMKRYALSYNDLLLVNECDQELRTKPGRSIYIPVFEGRREPVPIQEAREEDKVKVLHAHKGGRSRPVLVKLASRAPKSDYHVVKRGENLAAISERYGIDVATLKDINKLKKGKIHPNMRLVLTSQVKKQERPGRAAEKPTGNAVYHMVKKGETLSGIAGKYEIDVRTLKEMNRLKHAKVHQGMRLKVGRAKG